MRSLPSSLETSLSAVEKGICFPAIQRLESMSFPVEPWKARLEHFAPLPPHCSTMPSRCWQEAGELANRHNYTVGILQEIHSMW